jgi:hypothetical protein
MKTLSLHIDGDVSGDVIIAGGDFKSVFEAAGGRPFDPPVFVSYASADRELVRPLVKRLQKAGYTTWFDRESLIGGDDWKREIDQGLRKAMAVVITLTPNAIDEAKHEWAVYEQRESLRLFAPVIPVILKKTDDGEAPFPDYFAGEKLQYIDAATLNDESFGQIKAAIEKKIRRRGRHLSIRPRRPRVPSSGANWSCARSTGC